MAEHRLSVGAQEYLAWWGDVLHILEKPVTDGEQVVLPAPNAAVLAYIAQMTGSVGYTTALRRAGGHLGSPAVLRAELEVAAELEYERAEGVKERARRFATWHSMGQGYYAREDVDG